MMIFRCDPRCNKIKNQVSSSASTYPHLLNRQIRQAFAFAFGLLPEFPWPEELMEKELLQTVLKELHRWRGLDIHQSHIQGHVFGSGWINYSFKKVRLSYFELNVAVYDNDAWHVGHMLRWKYRMLSILVSDVLEASRKSNMCRGASSFMIWPKWAASWFNIHFVCCVMLISI